MSNLRNSEKGFSAVEIILVVVIIGVIGAVGWFIYNKQHKTVTPVSSTSSTSKPTTQSTPTKATGQVVATADKKIQVTIPDTWHVRADSNNASGDQVISVNTNTHLCDKYNPSNCSAIAPCLDTDDTVSCTYVAAFQPKALNPQTDQVWGLTVEKSDMTIAQASKQLLGDLTADNTLDKNSNKINGYDAFYVKVKSIGSDSYVDIHYFVTYKGYLIHFSNRVIENNTSVNPIHHDYSEYSDDFAKIVNSLKLSI